MRFELRSVCRPFLVVGITALLASPAVADSAFVTQASKGGYVGHSAVASPVTFQPQPSPPPHGEVARQTPETTVPATGGNFAGTLEMGRNNMVLQAQAGSGNTSNVGILGGKHDTVDVLQHGHGLVSNVALVGVKGLTVDVVQPPGTAPVNMLIARMPNGTLGIVQPKNAQPATVVRVGNVLVVK